MSEEQKPVLEEIITQPEKTNTEEPKPEVSQPTETTSAQVEAKPEQAEPKPEQAEPKAEVITEIKLTSGEEKPAEEGPKKLECSQENKDISKYKYYLINKI